MLAEVWKPDQEIIRAKIPLPQAIWNEFWLCYCERSEQCIFRPMSRNLQITIVLSSTFLIFNFLMDIGVIQFIKTRILSI